MPSPGAALEFILSAAAAAFPLGPPWGGGGPPPVFGPRAVTHCAAAKRAGGEAPAPGGAPAAKKPRPAEPGPAPAPASESDEETEDDDEADALPSLGEALDAVCRDRDDGEAERPAWKLGSGSCGDVYQCRLPGPPGRGVRVALKVEDCCHRDYLSDIELPAYRALGAAGKAAGAPARPGPGVPQVYGHGRCRLGCCSYIAMELLGECLFDVCARDIEQGTWHARRLLPRIATQLLRALEFIHGRGVFHRDVKPENVCFVRNSCEEVRLIDFGLAELPGQAPACPGVWAGGTLEFASDSALRMRGATGPFASAVDDLESLGYTLAAMYTPRAVSVWGPAMRAPNDDPEEQVARRARVLATLGLPIFFRQWFAYLKGVRGTGTAPKYGFLRSLVADHADILRAPPRRREQQGVSRQSSFTACAGGVCRSQGPDPDEVATQ